MDFGNAVKAGISSRASSRCVKDLGSLCSRAARTRSNWAYTASASGWSKTVPSRVFHAV
jgi:hypothetical protein